MARLTTSRGSHCHPGQHAGDCGRGTCPAVEDSIPGRTSPVWNCLQRQTFQHRQSPAGDLLSQSSLPVLPHQDRSAQAFRTGLDRRRIVRLETAHSHAADPIRRHACSRLRPGRAGLENSPPADRGGFCQFTGRCPPVRTPMKTREAACLPLLLPSISEV